MPIDSQRDQPRPISPLQTTLPASTLIFNGRPIWHNPAGVGHAFVKLRKDVHEEELIRRMWLRKCVRQVAEIAQFAMRDMKDVTYAD